jgi:hypothetical protein
MTPWQFGIPDEGPCVYSLSLRKLESSKLVNPAMDHTQSMTLVLACKKSIDPRTLSYIIYKKDVVPAREGQNTKM